MMKQRDFDLQYVILVSMVYGVGLAAWNTMIISNVGTAAIFLGKGLLAVAVVVSIDHAIKQAQWLYTDLAAFFFSISLIGVLALAGIPIGTLAVYLGGALVIGGMIGWLGSKFNWLNILFSVGSILSIFLSKLPAWGGWFFSLENLWGGMFFLISIFTVFGILAPTKEINQRLWGGVLSLILLLVWSIPVGNAISHGIRSIPLGAWLSFALLSIVVCILASSKPSSMWIRINFSHHAKQEKFKRFFVKKLQGDGIKTDVLNQFEALYGEMDPSLRENIFPNMGIENNADAYLYYLRKTTSKIGVALQELLPRIYQKADTTSQKAILNIFATLLNDNNNEVWQPALEKIIGICPTLAADISCQRIFSDSFTAIKYFFSHVNYADYYEGLSVISSVFSNLSPLQKKNIAKLLLTELERDEQKLTEQILDLLRQDDSLKEEVVIVLKDRFHSEKGSTTLNTLKQMKDINPAAVLAEASWLIKNAKSHHLHSLVALQDQGFELLSNIFPDVSLNQQREIISFLLTELSDKSFIRRQKVFAFLAEENSMSQIVLDSLQDQYRFEKGKTSGNALKIMEKISPEIILRQAPWIASEGDDHHIIKAMHLDKDVSMGVLARIVDFVDKKPLTKKRSAFLCDILSQYIEPKNIGFSVAVLLVMSQLSSQETIKFLMKKGDSMDVRILQCALGAQESLFPDIYWEWISGSDLKNAEVAVSVLGKVAC